MCVSVCVYECVSVCGYMSMSVRAPTWWKQEALLRRPRKQKGSKGQRGDWTPPGCGEMPGDGMGEAGQQADVQGRQEGLLGLSAPEVWATPLG